MNIADILQKSDLGEPYDRLSEFLELNEIIMVEQLYTGQQVYFRRGCTDVKTEHPELSATIGKDKALLVVKSFGNMRIYFPALRQSAKEKIKRILLTEFNGYNHTALARRYGYSERHIRNMVGGGKKRPNIMDGQMTLLELAAE